MEELPNDMDQFNDFDEMVDVPMQISRWLSESSYPIHGAFGLTYASYLVMHRSLLQRMPVEWQRKFVQLCDEYWQVWDCMKADLDFVVQVRDERGRFVEDPLRNYRHTPSDLIEAVRRNPQSPDLPMRESSEY